MTTRTIGRILPVTLLSAAALGAACERGPATNSAQAPNRLISFNCTTVDTLRRIDPSAPKMILIRCEYRLGTGGPVSINDTISNPWPGS